MAADQQDRKARVALPDADTDDPEIRAIFEWVTEMEGAVPNHFRVELNFPEFLKAKLGATRVLWSAGELTLAEIQHVGIAVSQANGCPYCTAAFCTILSYGMGTPETTVRDFVSKGSDAVDDPRLKAILGYALHVNEDPASVTDAEVEALRGIGLGDRGIVQLTHVVSDFASYNRLNLALNTDYDYRDLWRELAFGWREGPNDPPGDNTRGIR